MNLEEMKKKITDMDVKSDEFFELYKHVADKYYKFENPDTLQMSANMIMQWLDKSGGGEWEDHVIVLATMVRELFMMKHENRTACTGSLGFKDNTYFLDIYTSEVEKDKMMSLVQKAQKQMESGNIQFAGQARGPMKNKYFKKGSKK